MWIEKDDGSMTTSHKYHERMRKACDYIYQNLDKDLSVEHISDVAHFSQFHFHRQFTAMYGIGVYKFIQHLRLKRACYQLAFNQDMKLVDIAMAAGYQNHESFCRVFKKALGITPSAFREAPQWNSQLEISPVQYVAKELDMDVKIVTIDEEKIAVLEHRGSPDKLNYSVSKFIEWRKQSGLSPVNTAKTYGLAYDDPSVTAPEKFRFDICGLVKSEVPENDFGVINKVIPAGRCAVIRHLGSHDAIAEKVCYLYSQWIPESGEQLRDFPCFFHYLNLFPQVDECDLITDIYLPIE